MPSTPPPLQARASWLSVRFPRHPASAAVGWVYNVAGEACRHKVLIHLTPGPWPCDPRSEILTFIGLAVPRCSKRARYQ
eukprot:153829-Pyramimonas_sp.AAC.1